MRNAAWIAAAAVASKGTMEETVVVACCPWTVPEIVAVVVSALMVNLSPRGSLFAVQVNGALPLETVIWQLKAPTVAAAVQEEGRVLAAGWVGGTAAGGGAACEPPPPQPNKNPDVTMTRVTRIKLQ